MSRKIRKYDLNSISIYDLSSEGKGIGKSDGKIIFVKDALTGDILDVESKKTNKNYEEAKIKRIVTSSQYRQGAYCQHYDQCGGCKTQHISYAYQLEWKEAVVRNAIERIGGFQGVNVLPIIGCDETKYYRNKLDYAVSNKRWLSGEEIASEESIDRSGIGFHLAGMFDKVLDIDTCYHMPDFHNKIRNFIKTRSRELGISFFDLRMKKGCLRNIMIRNNVLNEWMLCIQICEVEDAFFKLLSEIKSGFLEIVSLQYIVNTKSNDTIYDQKIELFSGQDYIYEYLNDKKFRITPKSFFQTNTKQCIQLYDQIGMLAQIKPGDIVYDLYCGVGSIGIYLADKAERIVGIELVEEAILDARMNAKINCMDNCIYYASDIKDIFTTEFIEKAGEPDVIIVDPPRAGMHSQVVEALCQSKCKRIVYVSCNPQTMANDLIGLKDNYTIESIQPVDMFPNTIHIEAITLLKLKS